MPLDSSFPTLEEIFVTLDTGRPVSATRALLGALVAPYEGDASTETAFIDLALVVNKLAQVSNLGPDYLSYLKMALAVLISAVEHGDASPAVLEPVAKSIGNGISEDARLTELLARLNILISDHGTH